MPLHIHSRLMNWFSEVFFCFCNELKFHFLSRDGKMLRLSPGTKISILSKNGRSTCMLSTTDISLCSCCVMIWSRITLLVIVCILVVISVVIDSSQLFWCCIDIVNHLLVQNQKSSYSIFNFMPIVGGSQRHSSIVMFNPDDILWRSTLKKCSFLVQVYLPGPPTTLHGHCHCWIEWDCHHRLHW